MAGPATPARATGLPLHVRRSPEQPQLLPPSKEHNMLRLRLLFLALLLSPAAGITEAERNAKKKAIRMKTTRQLKEIFDELGIDHKGLSKDDLQKKAYKEDAVTKWEELHPEKKRKPSSGGGGGRGGMPDFGAPPEGTDPKRWEDMMRQMKGDFSGETDPEKRRILEKLAAKGMSFGGGNTMDLEQLKNMEKMMDGINLGKQGGGGMPDFGGMGGGPKAKAAPDVNEEEFEDEDKMEL